MAYTPTIWKDGQAPALNAENLNKIEQGIAGADTMANQALEAAKKAGLKLTTLWENPNTQGGFTEDNQYTFTTPLPKDTKLIAVEFGGVVTSSPIYHATAVVPYDGSTSALLQTPYIEGQSAFTAGKTSSQQFLTMLFNNLTTSGTFSARGYSRVNSNNTITYASVSIFKIFAIS